MLNSIKEYFNKFRLIYRLLVLLFFQSIQINAQDLFITDNQGRVIMSQKYIDLEGSPYLKESWTKAYVRLKHSSNPSLIQVKYDLVEDQLLFKNSKLDVAMEFIDQVIEFRLLLEDNRSSSYKSGYKPIDGNTEKNFYQILYDGNTQLLKRKLKKIIEDRPYNSAVTIKSFQEVELYYIAKANEPIKIKKDKKQILSVLNDRTVELEKYIQQYKLNVKEEEDLIKLIAYYNTL